MKRFAFSLDRVLAFRRLQREQEKAHLEKVIAEKQAFLNRMDTIRQERSACEHAFSHALSLDAYEVTTYPDWQFKVKQTLQSMAAEQSQYDERVRQQSAKLREAERQVKLLERLRERRHTEWQTQLLLEEEAFAAEAYLARCIRLKKTTPQGA